MLGKLAIRKHEKACGGWRAGVDGALMAPWWQRKLPPSPLPTRVGRLPKGSAEEKTKVLVTCTSFQHVAHLWFTASVQGLKGLKFALSGPWGKRKGLVVRKHSSQLISKNEFRRPQLLTPV